ncbi:hypothetical protein J1614_000746 [Plenodomus biglobosus]|nr:hypothetical protein J1614_000746 [Plenodomus biglobosus]
MKLGIVRWATCEDCVVDEDETWRRGDSEETENRTVMRADGREKYERAKIREVATQDAVQVDPHVPLQENKSAPSTAPPCESISSIDTTLTTWGDVLAYRAIDSTMTRQPTVPEAYIDDEKEDVEFMSCRSRQSNLTSHHTSIVSNTPADSGIGSDGDLNALSHSYNENENEKHGEWNGIGQAWCEDKGKAKANAKVKATVGYGIDVGLWFDGI